MERVHTIREVPSTDGVAIGWEQSGDGPPLVLVHGGTADRTRWALVLPGLEEHFTVASMDRRGRGLSGDSAEYSIEREYEDIAAVVDSFHEPAHLLGHSYGAAVALNATHLTKNIRSLVIYEGGGPTEQDTLPREPIALFEELIRAEKRDEALVVFMRDVVGLPSSQVDILRSLPAWQGRIAAAHTLVREIQAVQTYEFDQRKFERWITPTLILLGGDSPDTAKREAEALLDAIPRSRIAVLPSQQHAAMDTGTDIFLQEVVGFLLAN